MSLENYYIKNIDNVSIYSIDEIMNYGVLNEYGATLIVVENNKELNISFGFNPPEGLIEHISELVKNIESGNMAGLKIIDHEGLINYYHKEFEYKNEKYILCTTIKAKKSGEMLMK